MADELFAGLRATGDVVTNERPESWRAGILRLFPNGQAPLTGLTALMKSSSVDDPHYHWWTKTLTTQKGTVTGVYTDASLSTAYTSGGTAGSTLFFKMSAADSAMFRAGHQVLLRDASDLTVDVVGKVISVVANGASSNIAVRLLEADDNSTLGDLSDCDTALIIGNINPMGGTRPEAITQGFTEFSGYTQIFRNSLDLARTLMKTKLRTVDAYTEAKRDALEQHAIEMEKAFWWSIPTSTNVGSNGKPEYTTAGLMYWIKTYGVVEDFSLDDETAYAGKTWLQAGEEWLDAHLEEIFRYGSTERLAFCGSGALLGIQKLCKDRGFISLTPQTTSWGSKVREWITPFGSITLKTHPLFSYDESTRNSMVLIEPANIEYRYIDDTTFYADNTYQKGGGTGYDGKQEEYLTEAGLAMYFPQTAGYLNGIGIDNAV